MKILILGGTRLMGKHLTKTLIQKGHDVTIATRGLTADSFGTSVRRVVVERTDAESIKKAFSGKHFDVVCDSLAYCSEDVRILLDAVECGRYVMTSTISVYPEFKKDIKEEDFDPVSYPLKWCGRNDYYYGEIKRQAECALFQAYANIPAAAVRVPFVIGEDDYTKRLYFYVEHIINSIPINVDNLKEGLAFISSDEAGRFLAYLAESDFCGAINGASGGNITLDEIISYIENKTGKKAVFSADGKAAPYNGAAEFSVDTKKAESLGFNFSELKTWIYDLLDTYLKTPAR